MSSAPLRVLMVVHQFLPRHVAGSELYTFHLSKALVARGHEVVVYTTEAYFGEPHATLRDKTHDGLRVFEAVHNNAFPDFERTWHDPEKEAQLVRVLDAVRPDVVHVQHLHQHSLGYVAIAKARGLPVVYTLHEFLLLCVRNGWLVRPGWVLCEGPEPLACAACAKVTWPMPSTQVTQGDPWLAAWERRHAAVAAMLAQVDLCISPSRFLRDRFVAAGLVRPERILYSDNGIPAARLRTVPRQPSARLRLGYVGTIAEWKGVHLLVEAMDGLPQEVDCQIWGVLDYFPDYVASLRARARHPGIRFLGRFENERIAEVLAGIDVLVVPSLWFENSPITIHEAHLAHVPVVCGDRGGMAEYVAHGRNGLHFRMHDAADLRRQLARLASEPGLLASLRQFPPLKDIEADAVLMERRYRQLRRGEVPVA